MLMFLFHICRRLDIIENKETTSAFIIRKRKAWEEIAQRYNTHASSGPRTFYQLRHLYENLKQRSKKKSSLALENVFCVLGDMDTNDESNFTPPSPEGHGNYDFDIEIQCDQEPNPPLGKPCNEMLSLTTDCVSLTN